MPRHYEAVYIFDSTLEDTAVLIDVAANDLPGNGLDLTSTTIACAG